MIQTIVEGDNFVRFNTRCRHITFQGLTRAEDQRGLAERCHNQTLKPGLPGPYPKIRAKYQNRVIDPEFSAQGSKGNCIRIDKTQNDVIRLKLMHNGMEMPPYGPSVEEVMPMNKHSRCIKQPGMRDIHSPQALFDWGE